MALSVLHHSLHEWLLLHLTYSMQEWLFLMYNHAIKLINNNWMSMRTRTHYTRNNTLLIVQLFGMLTVQLFGSDHTVYSRMARRRFSIFLCVLLWTGAFLAPTFISERPNASAPALPDSLAPRHWAQQECVQRFLLSPTLPTHALWIIGLPLLSLPALANAFLWVVFTCCTLGVEVMTS